MTFTFDRDVSCAELKTDSAMHALPGASVNYSDETSAKTSTHLLLLSALRLDQFNRGTIGEQCGNASPIDVTLLLILMRHELCITTAAKQS